MATIRLTGAITEKGELKVDLPAGLPPGEVEIEIKLSGAGELPWEERPWTEEELQAFMHFRGVPAEQIMLGG